MEGSKVQRQIRAEQSHHLSLLLFCSSSDICISGAAQAKKVTRLATRRGLFYRSLTPAALAYLVFLLFGVLPHAPLVLSDPTEV